MLPSHFVGGIFSVGLLVLSPCAAFCQDYPNKPIRIITGSVGGGNDTAARQVGQAITGPLGQPVIVENRASALVAEAVAKSPADGYTLMMQGAAVWLVPLLQKVNYDMNEFSPISQISRDVFVVAVHPSLPVKSIKELIALAKARPGELNYSTGTTGSSPHLAGELMKSMAGVKIVGIPYTGSQIIPVVSGEVQFTIIDSGLVAPQAKVGKLRALAVSSATPSTLAPGLPTVSDSGLPGYEVTGFTGLFAPAKTSAAVVRRLNEEIVRFLNRTDVKEQFLNRGAEVVASSSEQFTAAVKTDVAKWSKVIKETGIKVN